LKGFVNWRQTNKQTTQDKDGQEQLEKRLSSWILEPHKKKGKEERNSWQALSKSSW